MFVLGLLLLLGLSALIVAAFLSNDGLFASSAGAVELFGYHAEPTVGQVFLTGASAGALLLVGLLMVFGGAGRRARRRIATRRELRAQRAEMHDLQLKNDSISSELSAQRAAEAKAAEQAPAPHDASAPHEVGSR
jgi:hypothetical protein